MAMETNGPVNSVKPNLPPKPVWKPGKVRVVRALYKYTAQNADELSFEEGQLLYIYDKSTDPNWLKAKTHNKEGLIPANYVEEQMEQIQLPLHEAARRGNLEFLRECLREGVSGTGLDATGNTPLYWAARAGHLSCVNELLSLPSPPVNVQNRIGDTALHTAASHGRYEVTKVLLEHEADPTIRNNDNMLPEDLCNVAAVKNLLQMSQRQCQELSTGYGEDDYNDESD